MNKPAATSFALSVAALLSACSKEAPPAPAAEEQKPSGEAEKVQCLGANECKGKSACHTSEHQCAGQNACKGKGWIELTRAECNEKGGKVM